MASIYKRNNRWWMSYFIDGKQKCVSLKTDNKKTALHRKALFEAKLNLGEETAVTGAEKTQSALDEFIAHLQAMDRSEKHVKAVRKSLGNFFDECSIVKLGNLKHAVVNRYIVQERTRVKQKGLSGVSTIGHFKRYLSAFVNWCVSMGYLRNNPVGKISVPRPEVKKPRFLTKDEAGILLEKSQGSLREMIAVSLFTGVRAGELGRIHSDHISWSACNLTVPKSKSGKFRTIPFSPELKQYVKPRSGDYFPFADIPLKNHWNNLRKETGIDVRWHDLRHTYASWLVMSGVDIVTVKEMMGHADISTTMIYAHLSVDHKRRAAANISLKSA